MPRVIRVSAGLHVLPAIRAVAGLWPTVAGFLLTTSLAAPALVDAHVAAGVVTEVTRRLSPRRRRLLQPAADELARPRGPIAAGHGLRRTSITHVHQRHDRGHRRGSVMEPRSGPSQRSEAAGSPSQLVACRGNWSTELSPQNPTSPAGWDRLMKEGRFGRGVVTGGHGDRPGVGGLRGLRAILLPAARVLDTSEKRRDNHSSIL